MQEVQYETLIFFQKFKTFFSYNYHRSTKLDTLYYMLMSIYNKWHAEEAALPATMLERNRGGGRRGRSHGWGQDSIGLANASRWDEGRSERAVPAAAPERRRSSRGGLRFGVSFSQAAAVRKRTRVSLVGFGGPFPSAPMGLLSTGRLAWGIVVER